MRVKKKNNPDEDEILILDDTQNQVPENAVKTESTNQIVEEIQTESSKKQGEEPKIVPPEKEIIGKVEPKPEFRDTSGSGSSTPSIKDALNAIGKMEPSADENKIDVNTEDVPSEPEESEDISSDNTESFEEVWEKYVAGLKADGPRIFMALSSQVPEFNEDGKTILISFRNNTLMIDFKQNYKPSLLSHLRGKLGIPSLEIEETILDIEDNSQSKHYTEIDKLKYMIEKNPALQKLRQDFGLDFE